MSCFEEEYGTLSAMTTKSKAELALLCMTAIWGSTFVFSKVALADVSAITMTAIRFTVSAAFFGTVFRTRIFPIHGPAILKGFFLGFLLFTGFLTQTIGLNYTTASKSAFITGMMVVLVPLLQIVIEKRPPKLGSLIGVVLAAGGLWLLTSPEGGGFNTGDALTIVCALCFAMYIVYLDIISDRMTALQLTFLQLASTAVLGHAGVILFGSYAMSISARSVGILAYLTIMATILTTYIQTRFQKETTPTRAVVIFTVEPVLAAMFAYFLLNEQLGSLGILGGAMILIGVLLSELSDAIPILNRPVGIRQ